MSERRDNPIENSIACSEDFDLNAIEPDTVEVKELHLRLAALAWREVLEWIIQEGRGRPSGMVVRIYAFLWCVHPDCLNGATQPQLAAKCGVKKPAFNRQVQSFRAKFGFKTSRMYSDERRANIGKGQRKNNARKRKRSLP